MADAPMDFSKFMSMDPDQQKAMGVQALMSGKVSPDEVSKAQTLISHPAFEKAIQGGQPVPPSAFAQAVTGQPNTIQPKKQSTTDSKAAKTAKNVATQNTYSSAPEFAARLKGVEDLPEVADERSSIKQAQDRLDMQRGSMPTGLDNTAWIRPLAAYVDSTQGTKLSAAANALPSQGDKLAGVNSAQDALIKRKNDLAKLIFEGGKQLKDGTQSNQMSDISQQINKLIVGDQLGSGGAAASARMAAIPIRAGQDFDKQLANSTKSIEAFNRGENQLNNPNVPLTDQTLHMVQQDISNGLSGSGQATDAKIAMDMQETIAGVIQKAKAKYRGTIGPDDDLRAKIPDIVQQINKVLKTVRQDYQDNIHRQADQIAKTYEGSYGSVPNLKETVESKRQAISDRFPKSAEYSATGAYGSGKATAPARTKALKDMSQKELDDYEASLHPKGT